MEVIIGVDGGTTAVKAVAFTLDGEIYATHHESVPVNYGPSGEAEQDMNLIWQAVADCLSSVVKQLDGHDIVGIGLTGQGDGVWLVDEVGEPVRPAANWMDGRAGDRVAAWTADGKDAKVLEVTGTSLFSGLFPVLLEELRENEPDVIARAGYPAATARTGSALGSPVSAPPTIRKPPVPSLMFAMLRDTPSNSQLRLI